MKFAKCYLAPEARETIPDLIPKLPPSLRPTHFAEAEDGPRFPLSTLGARGALGQLANSGYFLFAGDKRLEGIHHLVKAANPAA